MGSLSWLLVGLLSLVCMDGSQSMPTDSTPMIYPSQYVIMAPNTIRPGRPLTLSVNILDAVGSVFVEAFVANSGEEVCRQGEPCTGIPSTLRASGSVFANQITPITLQIGDLPPPPGGSYYLQVRGSGGLSFLHTNETLEYKLDSFIILIQTDKAAYKPGQTVRFRTMAVEPDMTPCANATFDIKIKDADGNIIRQWTSVGSNNSGVFSDELVLSSRPVLGLWSIEVTKDRQSKMHEILIDEFVLPRFDVKISNPLAFTDEDTSIAVTVESSFTFGRPLQGTASLEVGLKYSSERFQPIADMELVNGMAVFTITMIDLAPIFTRQFASGGLNLRDGQAFVIHVNVTDELSGRMEGADSIIRYFESPVQVKEHPDNPGVFKPGMNLNLQLVVSRADGEPLTETHLERLSRIVRVTVRSDGDESALAFPINSDGIVPLSIPVSSETNSLSLTVQARYCLSPPPFQANCARFTESTLNIYKTELDSPSGSYLCLEQLTPNLMVGQIAQFRVTTAVDSPMWYQVIAKGNILLTGSLNSVTTQFQFTVTLEMAPCARVIIYYVRDDGEVVPDILEFAVDGTFRHNVRVSLSRSEASPGNPVSVTVTADPNSFVGILAVDKSVQLFRDGNDLSRYDILSSLQSIDTTPINRYPFYGPFFPGVDYGPVFRKKRAVERQFEADTAGDLFDHAGMIVYTDSYVHTNRDDFYYYLFDGPVLALPGVPEVDRDNTGIDTDENEVDSGDESGARVRTEFPETWLWNEHETASDGTVFMTTTVPDTITTWVLSAFGLSTMNGLGLADPAELLTSQNFFISMNLPFSVVRGEQFELRISVFNYFSQPLDATLIFGPTPQYDIMLNDEEFATGFEPPRVLNIPANRGVCASFAVVPRGLGLIDLTVNAISALAADAVTRQLLVEPEGFENLNTSTSVILSETVISVSRTLNVMVASSVEDLVTDSIDARLYFTGDIMGTTMNNLDSLLRLPTGCGEQNMMGFAPDVFILKYLEVAGLANDIIRNKAISFLNTGYQTELTFRHGDCSYSAFGERGKAVPGSTWLTAFVVKSFSQAMQFIEIDLKGLECSIEFLTNQQQPDGSFLELGRIIDRGIEGGVNGKTSLAAYILIALQEALNTGNLTDTTMIVFNAIAKAQTYLKDQRLNVQQDKFTLAISSYALALSDSSEAVNFRMDLDRLANVTQESFRFWTNNTNNNVCEDPSMAEFVRPRFYRPPSIDIEMTAYALLAYISVGDIEQALPIVNWLIEQQLSSGGFGSTQDTVVGIQALAEYAASLPRNGSSSLTITTPDDPGFQRVVTVNQFNALELQEVELPPMIERVQITGSSSGVLVMSLSTYYNTLQPTSPCPAFRYSVDVTDRTFNEIEIRACGRYQGSRPATSMCIMEIGIPSGFTPSRVHLEEAKTFGDELFRDYEMRDRKVVCYFDEIPKDRRVCISFIAERTSSVGNGQMSYATLSDYYKRDEQVTVSYVSPLAQAGGICEFCPKCDCLPACGTIICPAVYEPVCGSDGRTYSNRCNFRAELACRDPDDGLLTILIPDGECPESRCGPNQPCLNGGSCISSICICPLGYEGDLCERVTGPEPGCGSNQPCLNGGTCVFGRCLCLLGYEGDLCERVTGPEPGCGSNQPCLNGGTCIFGRCLCLLGYEGDLCERVTGGGPCQPNPCVNGLCLPNILTGAGYFCLCSEGFQGTNCDQPTVPAGCRDCNLFLGPPCTVEASREFCGTCPIGTRCCDNCCGGQSCLPINPDMCLRICTLEYDPVCGSDGITYGNLCSFESAQCRNPFLTYTSGECGTVPCPTITICTLEYAPVCGSDGITYGNLCQFESAQCRNPSLSYTPGECGIDMCLRICTLEYDPVCGSDGITYGNLCSFESAQCRNPFLTYTSGECGTVPCPTITICTLEYEPVCGSDGITYGNLCQFESAQCRNPSLSYTPGECGIVPGVCVDCTLFLPSDCSADARREQCGTCPTGTQCCDNCCGGQSCVPFIPDPCDGISCDGSYIPVCGTDGITYDNFCELGRETCRNPRVLFQSFGECEVDPCDVISCDGSYIPVCGTDGITYDNFCELGRETCRNPRVLFQSFGECEVGNSCFPNPCRNRGSCIPTGTSYICLCQEGFSGENCDIGDCDFACITLFDPVCGSDGVTYSNECELSRATCRDPSIVKRHDGECTTVTPGCVSCAAITMLPCQPGSFNERCGVCPEATHVCCDNCCGGQRCTPRLPQPCASNPCRNGGSCVPNGPFGYECRCPIGYSGVNCESELDVCWDCRLVRVDCNVRPPTETCRSCPNATHECCDNCCGGRTCVRRELGPDPCDSDPCLNGGSCSSRGTEYMCSCPIGIGGYNCEDVGPDIIPPIIFDCIGVVHQYLTNGDFVPVSWEVPGYFDDRGGDVVLQNGPSVNSGFFPEGNFTLSYVYADGAGNRGSCNVDVIVEALDCGNLICNGGGPVCGTDLITYSDICELKRAACYLLTESPSFLYDGPCSDFDPCDFECSDFTRPVCGTDGITYRNPCELARNVCRYPDMALNHIGNCDVFPPVDPCLITSCFNGGSCMPDADGSAWCLCPLQYGGTFCDIFDVDCDPDPCRNGGSCIPLIITYICICPDGFSGDNCERDDCPSIICTLEYDPVCGSDGITYGNLCQFESAQCRNPYLTYTSGECGTVQCPTICTLEYDPVCGSDGTTYGNLCQFESAQCRDPSLTYTYGECGTVQCPTICTLEYAPVCGSDEVTYGNLCQFESAQCRNPSLTYTHGECGTVQCPTICTLEYAPVCGSDGVTYGNLCQFESAQCRNPSLTYTTGECGTVQCPTICTLEYAPVCGSDGVTYGNLCQFESAQCRNPSLTYTTGECGTVQCPTICTLEYAPVCGSDGVTYGNLCQFESAQCRNPSLTYTTGECGTVQCPTICTLEYAPVCGSDGITYGNLCQFESAQCLDPSLTYTTGECGTGNSCFPNPCRNRGSCIPTSTGYFCLCQDGFSGENCDIGDCDFACITLFDPVCGSDGVTYSNECELSRATCRDSSIVKRRDGECTDIGGCIPNPCRNGGSCIPTSTGYLCLCQEGYSGEYCEIGECDFACIALFDPVCGSDGVTYGNECELSRATCRDPSIVKRHDGDCTDIGGCIPNPCRNRGSCIPTSTGYLCLCQEGFSGEYCEIGECDFPCIALFDPVCGSDGVTYGNECELSRGTCRDPSIVKRHDGECTGLCPDGSRPVNCFVDPCQFASCPLYPNATCRANYCGGCIAEWFVRGEQVRCDGLCPDGSRPFNCFADPCEVTSCPLYPNAECRSNFCGGCNAEWFVGGEQVRCDGLCPDGSQPVNCFVDPCQFASCPLYPNAECRSNFCGGCNAEWFVDGEQVSCNVCDFACPAVFAPVCGSDGVTYPNSCDLSRAACRDPTIVQISMGPCTDACSFPCPEIFAPVCGSDGVTYPNSCELSRAACRDPTIIQVSVGSCTVGCASFPCENDGSCVPSADGGSFTCECIFGFSGVLCEILPATGPCANSPCQNGGSCAAIGPNDFVCDCPPNLFGLNCEQENTVIDLTAPILYDCPSMVQGFLTDGTYLRVEWQPPNAIDEREGEVSTSSGPQSNFGFFPQGEFTLSYTLSDASNNQESCSFPVIIEAIDCDNLDCSEFSEPVCGSNDQTYMTECALQSAACTNDGLTVKHRGPCRPDPCDKECPTINRPVCGTDGVTYRNPCELSIETCRSDVDLDHLGICDDACTSEPCLNGGDCQLTAVGTYFCMCPTGYRGRNCEIEGSLCDMPNICQNGGSCTPGGNTGYMCQCAVGFFGTNCEIAIQPCSSDPCLNGGTCVPGNVAFFCLCEEGFVGRVCEIDTNVLNITCPSNDSLTMYPLLNGGQEVLVLWPPIPCVDRTVPGLNLFGSCNETSGATFRPGSTTVGCSCTNPSGNVARCTFTVNIPVPDACASRPCLNGGECRSTPFGNYMCMCRTGFRGQNCEVAFSPLNITCPAASAIDVIATPDGQSAAFWENPTCIEGTGLAPNLFASCNRTIFEVFPPGNTTVGCQCANAAGEFARCTFTVNVPVPDACASRPCFNGGECQSTPFGNYICMCQTGFRGQNCEVAFSPLNITCPAASTVNVISIPSGQSIAIWPNPTCIEGIGLAPNLFASCNRTLGEVFPPGNSTVGCQCTNAAGEVARCTFNVNVPDACDSSPCLNGGECQSVPFGNSYICTCPTGFIGQNCEIAFRPLNITCPAASTVDVIRIPNGQSLAIWPNPTCTEGTGLAPNIVASCDPTLGSIFPPGITTVGCQCTNTAGEVARCTFDVDVPIPDPCASSPCLNGATCLPTMLGDYTCQCAEGFTGLNCDQAVLTITCPASSDVIIIPTPNGQLGIWGPPPCTQGAALPTIFSTCDPPVGILSPGENPVTCTCRSLAGEVASCTFIVDVPVTDPCASSPCLNGATCSPTMLGDYVCQCTEGFTGLNCDQAVLTITCPTSSDVLTFPAQNGQTLGIWGFPPCTQGGAVTPILSSCDPPIGSSFLPGENPVTCSCRSLAGEVASCTFNVDIPGPCASSPCINGGMCLPSGINSYTCDCPAGFFGTNCEQVTGTLDIPCPDTASVQTFPITNGRVVAIWQPIQCVDSARPNLPIFADCIPTTGSIFQPGNTMVDCSCTNAVGDIASCSFVVNGGGQGCASFPCENDGRCIPGADGASFTCECLFGFTGPRCENAPVQTACTPNPCMNGGVCNLVGLTSFSCSCPTAFIGTRCEQEQTACNPNPCQNGGACSLQGISGFSCTCASGFTGVTCGQVQTACNPNPCINGGVCNLVGLNSFSCNCPTAFIGTRCEQERTACNPNPCQNGGACSLQGINGFSCTCASGFTGVTCGQVQTACNPNPCINGGVCNLVGLNSFSCNCPTAFIGTRCEQERTACNPNPCQNGGACSLQGINGFTCTCASGFTGVTCGQELTACNPNPCQNGGACTLVGITVFSCTCVTGFTGVTCGQASVINCPTVGLNFLDSEVITWTEPSVSGGTRVSQTHFPGISEFPLGTTVVMYQFAVPGSTQLLTCAFPVTVTRDPNSAGLVSFPARSIETTQTSSSTTIATLSCTVQPDTAEITWLRNGNVLQSGGRYFFSQNRDTLWIVPVTTADAGPYQCRATVPSENVSSTMDINLVLDGFN